jgi:integrase
LARSAGSRPWTAGGWYSTPDCGSTSSPRGTTPNQALQQTGAAHSLSRIHRRSSGLDVCPNALYEAIPAQSPTITRKRFTNGWNATRIAAKLPHRIFHDFRRAAARRLTNAGVPQVVSMQVTGHKTASMFRRYSIVEKVDMARGLDRVARREESAKVRRMDGHRNGHR